MSEPKVTECWVERDADGCPDIFDDMSVSSTEYTSNFIPCVAMWRHDHDALIASLKHREELYWKLTAEFDAMRGELEELRAKRGLVRNALERQGIQIPEPSNRESNLLNPPRFESDTEDHD